MKNRGSEIYGEKRSLYRAISSVFICDCQERRDE